jgi:ceramide glucosyltransferase
MANFVLALLVIGAASLILTLATHVSVVVVRRRPRPAAPGFAISVLKPLKGVDAELWENLVSFARQDHPAFELLLGCEDPLDPALAVAWRLVREFPDVAIKVVAGGYQTGLNPKVNNLSHIARAARYEHWLISDADVRVGPDYLTAVAAEMIDPRVGLVSNIIAATSEQSLASAIESLHVNTFIARSVCGADVLAGHPCVVGKSMLFRRADLERLGGLAAVKDVLAEDYVLGQLFRDAGYRVALSPYAIHTVNTPRGTRELVNRHVRWSQMRRHLAPKLYWGEPMMMPTLWLSFALLGLWHGPMASEWRHPMTVATAAGLVVLGLADALMVREICGRRFDPRYAVLGIVRDFAAATVWVVGAFRRTVVWRGNAFFIGPGSTLLPHRTAEADARTELEAEV